MKTDKHKDDADGQLKSGLCRRRRFVVPREIHDGETIGEWKYYLRNGLLKAIGRFSNGKMTGEWKWYRENGKLMQTGSFDDEKKAGTPMAHCMTRANTVTIKRSANGGPMTPKAS